MRDRYHPLPRTTAPTGQAAYLLPVAVLGLLLGWVWVAGALAALLAGNPPPTTGPSRLGGVLVRLLADPAHPAAAWPPADQPRLPGPWLFWTAATLTGLAAAAAGAGCWWVWVRLVAAHLPTTRYGARWATRRDVADLVVRPGTDLTGRITLGVTGWGARLATSPRHSLLVFGPTLSGKTTSFVIPTVIGWRGPVIATSSKVDMVLATRRHRAGRGTAVILDPFGASGLPSIRWSPLAGASTWAEALDMAYWLARAASISHSIQNADFWETLAEALLAPMLYAAANKPGGTMLDVVAWANDYNQAYEVLTILAAIADRDPTDPGPTLAASAFMASVNADPRRKDSIYGTAQVLLKVYQYPAVAQTASGCDLDRDAFLRGVDDHGNPVDHTVYVYAPEHRQAQLRPLYEAFIAWLIRGAEDRYARTGLPLDPPLLVMLDEAANIAPLRKLAAYASTGASQGIQLTAIFQDLGQLETVYGQHAPTILTNFLAKVLMAGSTDRKLLDYLGYIIGREDAPQGSLTYAPDGARTATHSLYQRDLAPAHFLAQQRPGHAIALLSYRPPIRLRVHPHTSPSPSDPRPAPRPPQHHATPPPDATAPDATQRSHPKPHRGTGQPSSSAPIRPADRPCRR